jgi:glycosyltransferase involved in cell wall biosynthesis
LRIAINAALLGKRHTGVGTYIAGLVRSLTALGHEVVVFGRSPLIPSGPRITQVSTPAWMAFDANGASGWLRMLWNAFVLPLRLLRRKVDAAVSQNAEGMVWSPVPQLLVVHDLIPLHYPEEAPRLNRYYRRILPWVLKRAAAVVTVSEYTRSELLQRYGLNPASVQVAYDGVEQRSSPALSHGERVRFAAEPYFLFVGTFSPRKNLETVLRALASIRDQVPEKLLIVAYPDRWTREALRLAEELKLSDRITQLSGLTDGEMRHVYEHATALFLLSEYEGFGLPAVEAMLAGTPAVVSDSTALAEVAGEAAIRVGAKDVTAVSAAMLRLANDGAYRERMRHVGMQRARTFTWARTGTTISDVLCQAVQDRGLRPESARASQ